MKKISILKTIPALFLGLMLVAVIAGRASADGKSTTLDGQIVESSWSDRRIAVRVDQSGSIVHFLVPPKVTIAGSADLQRDPAAFQKYLGRGVRVRVVQGRQIRHSLFAAVDIFPL